MASEEIVSHSPKQMEILNKFYKRLKKERFVNNQSSQYYSNLGNRFVIPGIIITGLSSVVSFLATSSMLDEDEKQGCGVTVGVLTAIATIVQSMSASFGFQLKKDAFAGVVQQVRRPDAADGEPRARRRGGAGARAGRLVVRV